MSLQQNHYRVERQGGGGRRMERERWSFPNGSEPTSGGRGSKLEFRDECVFARQSGDRQADGNYPSQHVET